MRNERGFTLIEVMITVAIVAILAAVALPSYTAYIQRSRVPPALDTLSSVATRLEQRYQDTGNYGNAAGDACGVNSWTDPDDFAVTCALDADDGVQGYLLTATGSGRMSGYTYTLNHRGQRVTTAHPKGANAGCWTMKGTVCDS